MHGHSARDSTSRFRTDAGTLDLFDELAGVGGYGEAARDAEIVEPFGRRVAVVSLDVLERAKRAAGRAKDLLDLEAIRVLRRRPR